MEARVDGFVGVLRKKNENRIIFVLKSSKNSYIFSFVFEASPSFFNEDLLFATVTHLSLF